MGFLPLLGLLFVGLKLTHVIAWSWWLILLPVYGPLALVVVLAMLAAAGIGLGAGLLAMLKPKRPIAQVGRLRPLGRY